MAYAWSSSLSLATKAHVAIVKLSCMTRDNYVRFIDALFVEFQEQDLSLIVLRRFDNKIGVVIGMLSIGRTSLSDFGEIYYGGSGQGTLFGEIGDLLGNIPEALAMIGMPKAISDRIQRVRLLDNILESRLLLNLSADVHMGGTVETLVLDPAESFKKLDNSLYAI